MPLLLTAALLASTATLPTCSWDRPGAGAYVGTMAAAVDRYADIPQPVREALKARMARHAYDEVAAIRRDSITGRSRYAPELRQMHFGAGQVCGTVTRSRWSEAAVERGLVYCESGHCLIVPTVCRNVSRITRLGPAEAAADRTAASQAGGGSGPAAAPGSDTAATPPTAAEADASFADVADAADADAADRTSTGALSPAGFTAGSGGIGSAGSFVGSSFAGAGAQPSLRGPLNGGARDVPDVPDVPSVPLPLPLDPSSRDPFVPDLDAGGIGDLPTVLSPVPEPGAMLLALAGLPALVALVARVRRQRRRPVSPEDAGRPSPAGRPPTRL